MFLFYAMPALFAAAMRATPPDYATPLLMLFFVVAARYAVFEEFRRRAARCLFMMRCCATMPSLLIRYYRFRFTPCHVIVDACCALPCCLPRRLYGALFHAASHGHAMIRRLRRFMMFTLLLLPRPSRCRRATWLRYDMPRLRDFTALPCCFRHDGAA